MASYNPVHNNCCRDSIVVSLINCFTSLLASLVVFAVLGFKVSKSMRGLVVEQCMKKLAKYTLWLPQVSICSLISG